MAKKELSITLRARNALMSGIAGARRTLMKFGGWVTGLGKRMAFAFLGASAGLAGFVALTARAYAKQERAEKSLASALASHGENVDALLPKLKAAAAAIQDQTGAGDEQTLQTMASLKLLGVHTDALEQAAKATIALKSAGVEEAQATKMVALATAGNYTMLSRYLPALRTATSETEKAAAVNDFLSKGYKQQRDLLNTTGGAWAALRGRVGDVLEEFGRAINKSDALSGLLNRAGDAVKRFGERITAYVDSERFKQIQESVTGIIQAIGEGGDSRREVFAAFGDALKAAFAMAAQRALDVLKAGAVSVGDAMADGLRRRAKDMFTGSMPTSLAPDDGKKYEWDMQNKKWVARETGPSEAMLSRELDYGRAIENLFKKGIESYTPPPPKRVSIEDFDIAGKGGTGAGASERTEFSGYLQNMMSRIREMGHDVEEYGTRSPFDAERNQERLAVAAEEGARLEKRTNELLEETRDLLKENLSQG